MARETVDAVVVGAGAAGLMCAMEAGKRGRRVVVLEHNPRTVFLRPCRRRNRRDAGGGVRGVYRASADLAKCGLRDTKFSAVAVRLVKLQRPPPEIGILRAIGGLCSSTTTRRPRLPASMAHISPAAPAPTTTASTVSRAILLHSGRATRYAGFG